MKSNSIFGFKKLSTTLWPPCSAIFFIWLQFDIYSDSVRGVSRRMNVWVVSLNYKHTVCLEFYQNELTADLLEHTAQYSHYTKYSNLPIGILQLTINFWRAQKFIEKPKENKKESSTSSHAQAHQGEACFSVTF